MKIKKNFGNTPFGALSETQGYATETNNFGEAAFGILNKSTIDEDNFTSPDVVKSSKATLFSVGNGSDGVRKNIIELKADGTVYISGIGSYDGTTTDGASTIQDTIQDTNDKVQNVIEELEKVNTSIDSINIEKSQDSDLVYTLRVDGEDRGTINIPKDQFLKDVSYNDVTNELVFTFVTKDTDNKEVRVNLTDLVDIYTAGNGINIDNKQISVKIDGTSDPYIQLSADGIKITGINEALEDYLPLSGGTMTGNITFESTPDANGHEYVDLGLPSGNLWAKCNIGANSEEEVGLYFQWGDTQGYTAEQIGYGEGLKAFRWTDYKFSINGSENYFSKYDSDGKTVLDLEDDAAHVNMGGNWRMPTSEEYKELCLNTDIYLVPTEGEEIQGTAQEQSGSFVINWASQAEGTLRGVKFYKKGDKQTYMFVPVSGAAYYDSVGSVGKLGYLWASSLRSSIQSAWDLYFSVTNGRVTSLVRCTGLPVRGVLSSNTENSKGIIIDGKTESDLLNAAGSTTTVQSILDQVPEPDLSPLQNAIGDNTYEGSNYLTKETNLTDAAIQLDEEIKATNDNLALEHANAEATYAKKTDVTNQIAGIETKVQSKVDNNKWDSLPDHILFAIASEGVNYTDSSVSWNHSYVAKTEDGSYDTAGRSTTKTINAATSTTAGVMEAKYYSLCDALGRFAISSGSNRGIISGITITPSSNDVSLKYSRLYFSDNTYGSFTDVIGIKKINAATTSNAGVMSASDKTKLDSIDLSGIQVVTALPDAPNENTMYIVIPA